MYSRMHSGRNLELIFTKAFCNTCSDLWFFRQIMNSCWWTVCNLTIPSQKCFRIIFLLHGPSFFPRIRSVDVKDHNLDVFHLTIFRGTSWKFPFSFLRWKVLLNSIGTSVPAMRSKWRVSYFSPSVNTWKNTRDYLIFWISTTFLLVADVLFILGHCCPVLHLEAQSQGIMLWNKKNQLL